MFPGSDSQRVGWMIPSPCIESLLIVRNPEAFHVFPSSSLLSTKAFHTPFFSFDAGASHVPLERMITLFFTGPRPPRSPGTSSCAVVQVVPLSSEVMNHVSHRSILLPTLKKRINFPFSVLKRTGFQWGSSLSFAISIGRDH